jgi:glycosyltransferase involved in cell wall biosynthesis
MRYLAGEVVPALERIDPGPTWRVAICGRGTLPPDLERLLDHPRIVRKGFVPDIDQEILSSPVFLLCNNAGPYTGGYTRVIYVMSSGGCLVAHSRLADSMPEVVHGENALLGDTPDAIAALVTQALWDPDLRRRIGEGARLTYGTVTNPARVAAQLADMAARALAEAQAA